MNKRIKHYLQEKTGELLEHKMGVEFVYRRQLPSGCQGLFDEQSLKVAIGGPQKSWVPVFVHEYSHFRQYIEDAAVWKRWHRSKIDLLAWAADPTEKATSAQLDRSTRVYQELEQDCDRRAVEEIEKHQLPVDLEDYIRKSNVYIWFYNIVRTHRSWYDKAPYDCPEIVALAPSTFIRKEDYGRMPRRFESLVVQHAVVSGNSNHPGSRGLSVVVAQQSA